ncbi:hypothetical protein scyTo_0021201 [Scyliorhinus torazame]|uniref:Immunoglobulin I-set domain-containing protein n=1 Tax=Scyliorhinus torazame TaxID=75743 RepID=A0A401PZ85_SCYTO|nr:hypothetical protein [Scyliorhinus torazame]
MAYRIEILPDKALQILVPNESDVGIYTCTATSPAGFDSLSSKVAITGKPEMRVSKHDLVNFNSTSVRVDVGSVVKARLMANITILCQVTAAIPEPILKFFLIYDDTKDWEEKSSWLCCSIMRLDHVVSPRKKPASFE